VISVKETQEIVFAEVNVTMQKPTPKKFPVLYYSNICKSML